MSATLLKRQYSHNYSHGTNSHKPTNKIRIFIEDQILSNKKFSLSIFPWLKIAELKKQIQKSKFIKNATENNLRLFYKNIQLVNNKQNVMDFNVQADSIIVAKMNNQKNFDAGIVNPYKLFQQTPRDVTHLIMNVIDGLNGGSLPKLTPQGTSGTYILQNSNKKKIAIFKPYDQEPYTPNNPRNYIGKLGSEGIRKGILSGQSATRQVAAYLLSSNGNYHDVPVTIYIEFYHPSFQKNKQNLSGQPPQNLTPIKSRKQINLTVNKFSTKHGSLQQFIQYNDVIGNFGSGVFEVSEIHKIGILDLRILNCDRNQANILVKKLSNKNNKICYKLIPIDHGLSFPDNFQIFEHQLSWMSYSQSKQPFSQAQLLFISQINPQQDTKNLREKLGFREICLRNFRIAEIFLKKAAINGFTLYQIGKMMLREGDDGYDSQDQDEIIPNKPSQLQILVQQAENLLYSLTKQKAIEPAEVIEQNVQQCPCGGQCDSKCDLDSQSSSDQFNEIDKQFFNTNVKVQNQKISHSQLENYDCSQSTVDIGKQQKSVESQKIISVLLEPKSKSDFGKKNDKIQPYVGRQSKRVKRKLSLPTLKRKSTSYRQLDYKEMRQRQGMNGVSKSYQKKRSDNEQWQQMFFYYFEISLDTFLLEKNNKKEKPNN